MGAAEVSKRSRPAATTGATRTASIVGQGFRPEIQALRAVAVLCVVFYHFWPQVVPGGYVGVDVFFAISGYLIIGHLLREAEGSGRINLLAFWARRARRLLPASLLVLIVVTIVVVIWVPRVSWVQYLREIGASALYVQNWQLAYDAVDYLAASNAPSPVQHFWSLSVEEQFYIGWPLLIVVLLAILRRLRSDDGRRRGLGVLLVTLTIAGVAASLYFTQTDPAFAYFATTTRVWEFSLGGVLAWVMMRNSVRNAHIAALMSWAGLALIAVSVFTYTSATPFPGYAAIVPVVGTLLTIAAGLPAVRWSPSFVFQLQPIQWVGDTSYSLYLWHWSFLILAPALLHAPVGLVQKMVILLLVFAVAWASTTFVEDRFRIARPRRWTSWKVVLVAVVASSLMFAGSLIATQAVQQRIDAARSETLQLIDAGTSCLGAAAFGPDVDCLRPFAVTQLTDPAIAAQDIGRGVQIKDACKQTENESGLLTCELGDTPDPAHTIAIVGDSHAGHYLEPLELYAEKHSWRIITYLKSYCLGTGVPGIAAADSHDIRSVESCAEWGRGALDQIAADPSIDAVVFSNFTTQYVERVDPDLGRPVTEDDFATAWSGLEQAGKHVIVIRDLPRAAYDSVPSCVAEHLTEYDPCTNTRREALPEVDPQWSAALDHPTVGALDLTDYICDPTTCHAVIGGLIVYFDGAHLTATYARTFAPFLGNEISGVLSG